MEKGLLTDQKQCKSVFSSCSRSKTELRRLLLHLKKCRYVDEALGILSKFINPICKGKKSIGLLL